MTSKKKRVGWGALPAALFAALQWRVMLLWIVLMALPTAIMALPFGRVLGSLLDHSVQSAALAHHFDGLFMGDAITSLAKHGAWFNGSSTVAMVVTLLLSPFLTGIVITAVRAMHHPRLGELMHGGLSFYWRMLRLMLWSLLPYIVAIVIGIFLFRIAGHRAAHATLESTADTGFLVAKIVLVVLLVLAHAMMESSRAQFGADEGLRSATRAFFRGVSMLVRRPLATLGLYLGTSIIGYVLVGLVAMVRIRVDAVGVGGYIAAILLTQLIVIILAWQRTARLDALARLARVTAFGGRSSAAILAPA